MIKEKQDRSTIFLRQDVFDSLGFPTGTKVSVTVRDTERSFDNVTLGLDSDLEICVVRLSLPYREALLVSDDTSTPTPAARPNREFDIALTSLPLDEVIDFQGKVCQLREGQDPNTIFLRLPEYNDFGVLPGTMVRVTVVDTGRTVDITLGVDSGLAVCAVRIPDSYLEDLDVADDIDTLTPAARPDRQFSICIPEP